MKALVISTLRLGDFIQTIPVLNALKTQLQLKELDVLVHKPVANLKPMLPVVNNWFTLDRDELQAGLGEADVPLLTSFSILKDQMDQLDRRRYNVVINLTQTEQSGWLAGYLSAEQRFGLSMDRGGRSAFHSPWFRYLNDHLEPGTKEVFHHTDIFFYGCGLKGSERVWNLRETRHGKSELAALNLDHSKPYAVLQPLTSDPKKNWSEQSWSKMLQYLRLMHPSLEFVALGAPSEADAISSLIAQAKTLGVVVRPAIMSLEGAHSLLKKSKILITGDTSIKHLAQASDVAILELSLGSSDFRRTGSYSPNSLIINAKTECSPCRHSSPCSMSTHRCSELLEPEMIATAAFQLLNRNWNGLSQLASEFTDNTKFYRTRFLSNGFWWPLDLTENSCSRILEQWIELVSWKLQLNFEVGQQLLPVGSEGVDLSRELQGLDSPTLKRLVHSELDQMQNLSDQTGHDTSRLLSAALRQGPQIDERGILSIHDLRLKQSHLQRQGHRAQLKTKLIRTFLTQTMESK